VEAFVRIQRVDDATGVQSPVFQRNRLAGWLGCTDLERWALIFGARQARTMPIV
jgi:hypothetical protein